MITLGTKIKLLNLMEQYADDVLPEGYKEEIKQCYIEDDMWHNVLEINLYDSDEYYKNIEPLYTVYCTDCYNTIRLYKNGDVIDSILVEDAEEKYNERRKDYDNNV